VIVDAAYAHRIGLGFGSKNLTHTQPIFCSCQKFRAKPSARINRVRLDFFGRVKSDLSGQVAHDQVLLGCWQHTIMSKLKTPDFLFMSGKKLSFHVNVADVIGLIL